VYFFEAIEGAMALSEDANFLATLKVDASGKVTLPSDVLHHLGAEPGSKLEVENTPEAALVLKVSRKKGGAGEE
jgi:bifunctional DNA-binding transcriptional regulator/antitoxin component of YhaV-PrlF toxin-antitoxin module